MPWVQQTIGGRVVQRRVSVLRLGVVCVRTSLQEQTHSFVIGSSLATIDACLVQEKRPLCLPQSTDVLKR